VYLLVVDQLGIDSVFPSQWYNLFFGYVGLSLCAYCLFRSVSSLVPTISRSEPRIAAT
jgi:hypothetical protein